ncbi:MAG TPA: single-stranded-DNA-specific exonuclease RecJ, partial [Rhodanobacteraceae bacterium]|nr:single-stranded-DNA-specific exonuclease RecJ [Rhodanobacteraceae bacterium]
MRAFTIKRRACGFDAQAWPSVHPVLARIYASRGISAGDSLEPRLSQLADPAALGGIERACELLGDAVANDLSIVVVGDFDADGATGTAVAVRALRMLGAKRVSYRVP